MLLIDSLNITEIPTAETNNYHLYHRRRGIRQATTPNLPRLRLAGLPRILDGAQLVVARNIEIRPRFRVRRRNAADLQPASADVHPTLSQRHNDKESTTAKVKSSERKMKKKTHPLAERSASGPRADPAVLNDPVPDVVAEERRLLAEGQRDEEDQRRDGGLHLFYSLPGVLFSSW